MKKRTHKKDTSKKELDYNVNQIAWVIDPDAGPEDLPKFVLARFKETSNVWTVYEVMSLEKVKSTKNPFRYYYYLFILSALAYRQLQRDKSKQSTTSKEPLIQFPMYAKDPVYGRLVRHYYNIKGKEGETRRYLAIPTMLRDGMRAMFEPKSKGGAAKNSRVELIDGVTIESFHFWNVEGFPVDMFSDQTPKEIDIEKLNFPKTPVNIEIINDSIHQFRSSKQWNEWEKRQKSASSNKNFTYLRSAEDILEIDRQQKPEWFRKKGPIAADFDDGRVYRREEKLNELKEFVMNSSVSMLEGIGATGKTVLVLNLAYDLYEEGEKQIYYFDCDKKRDFDESKLVSDIKSVKGIFILENIHLEPKKFQSIYFDFKYDVDRHLLFTTRPSFRDFKCSRSEDLTQIESLKIEPFDEVDAIIKNFSSHEETPVISTKTSEQLKAVSLNSFWLLSYALVGYGKSDREGGDTMSWLEKGVQENLNDLKNIGPVFPEVLMALSPLYKYEILTAESYLIGKLGFDYEVLDQLTQMCEITCQEVEDGVVFYGLPHSTLADAYWKYGLKYKKRRRLPEYKDFIYDYAKSEVPNGLEAIVRTAKHVREQLITRIGANEKLSMALQNEPSTIVLQLWIESADTEIVAKDYVLTAIVQKIEELDDPSGIPGCISAIYHHDEETRRAFWNLLDHKKIKDRITKTGRVLSVVSNISAWRDIDKIMGHKFCDLLNLEDLAAKLNQVENLRYIGEYISKILRVNEQVGQKLWQLIDKKTLVDRLSHPKNLLDVMQGQSCIGNIYDVNNKGVALHIARED